VGLETRKLLCLARKRLILCRLHDPGEAANLGAIALDLCFGDARSKIAKAERRWSDEIGANSRNGCILGSALKPSLEALTRRYGAAKALLAESREAHDFLTCFNVGRLVLPW
jgi:hypothetical protein